jgi:DNA repair and recombination protein RAD54B
MGPPQRDNKLIIVSYFTSTLELVEKYLRSQRIKYTQLTGKLPPKVRDANVKKFLNDKPGSQIHVFLLGAKAGGTGLNLVQCQRMVMMDVDWNPGNDRQVVGRVWRKGQKKPVYIYRLVMEGTVEEVVVAR